MSAAAAEGAVLKLEAVQVGRADQEVVAGRARGPGFAERGAVPDS